MWSPSFSWLILGLLIAKLMQQHSPASSFKDCAQGHLNLTPSQASSLTSHCIKKYEGDQISAKLRDGQGSKSGPAESSQDDNVSWCRSRGSVNHSARQKPSCCRSAPAVLPEYYSPAASLEPQEETAAYGVHTDVSGK